MLKKENWRKNSEWMQLVGQWITGCRLQEGLAPRRSGRHHAEMYDWLGEMKKKDEERKLGEVHQRKIILMIKSADGSARLLHRSTKHTEWRGGVQILKEEDVTPMDRCEEKRKEWARHWQCDADVQNQENRPWENEELKKAEDDLPRLPECYLAKAKTWKARTGVDCDGVHPKVPSDLAKETKERRRGILGEGENQVGMAAASLHCNVLPLECSSWSRRMWRVSGRLRWCRCWPTKVGVGNDDAIWIVNWITKRRRLFEEWRVHP